MGLTFSINGAAAFNMTVGVPGPAGSPGAQGPQGPAGPAGATFTGGAITSPITYTSGNIVTVFENGDIYAQDNSTNAYGAVFINGFQAYNGTQTLTATAEGITFGDSTTQTTAFPGSSYFYPRTGNPDGFATQAWVTGQNYLTVGSLASYATMSYVNNALVPYATQSYVTDHAYPLTGNPSGFITSSALTGYATQGWVGTQLANYATLSYVNTSFYGIDNPSGFITSADLTNYATKTYVNSQGFITSSALTPYLTSATASATYQTLSGMSSYLAKADNLSGLSNTGVARNNLGLGSIATHSTTEYAVTSRGLPSGGTSGQVLSKSNGSDYNVTWSTPITGDRYLTTSTTSLTVSNGNKTLTVGTGLSYTTQQDVTIAYDAAHHMHGVVTSYNSSTGAMVVDVQNNTGSGTYTSWTVNVGGTVPLTSVTWGSITGTLGSQSDLSSALNAKLAITTAAAVYQTQADMSNYLTNAAAASSYYPLGGNPSGFITASALSPYLTSSTAASTYYPLTNPAGYLAAGNGGTVPTGGTTGQVLAKASNSDYSLVWTTASGGSFDGGAVTNPITITDGTYEADFSATSVKVFDVSNPNNLGEVGFNQIRVSQSGTAEAQVNNWGFSAADLTSSGSIGSTLDYAGLNIFNGTDAGLVSPNSVTTNHSETDSYGTQNYSTQLTAQQTTLYLSGYDANGSTTGSGVLNYGGMSFSFSSTTQSGTGGVSYNGASGSITNYGTSQSWSVGPSGLSWSNGTVYGTFDSSGVRFPDGSVQTTAYTGSSGWSYNFAQIVQDLTNNYYSTSVSGSPSNGQVLTFNAGGNNLYWSSPGGAPYSNAIWYGGNWYAANVSTVYDSMSSYINVLSF